MTRTAADRIPVRPDLADVAPYGAPQLDVPVRLNTNETPFPPPTAFLERLGARVAGLDLHRYPDRRAWTLRTALGERFGLPPERLWAANGSNEILQQLLQAYGGPGRTALLLRPGYSMYPLLARVTSTGVHTADLDADFGLSPETAAAAVQASDPDLVLVASPNNPTGMAVGLDAVRALHDHSRGLVVLDEAYIEFSADAAREFSVADAAREFSAAAGASGVALLEELPRLAVCRTFSKAWRLAGLRLGYLLAREWVVDDLRKVRLPYHLDSLTQAAGLLACEMADQVTAHVPQLAAERDRLSAALAATNGVTVWPSAANFLLFRTPLDGRTLFERLLERGVLVRDFSSKPRLERCLRVSVGTPEENDAFLAALKESL